MNNLTSAKAGSEILRRAVNGAKPEDGIIVIQSPFIDENRFFFDKRSQLIYIPMHKIYQFVFFLFGGINKKSLDFCEILLSKIHNLIDEKEEIDQRIFKIDFWSPEYLLASNFTKTI